MIKEKSARRPWTESDNKELKEMLQAGRRSVEIARKLGRTSYAINARVELLNKKVARANPGSLRLKRWTVEENERLRALAVAGERYAAIAKQLNRSEQAVRHRFYDLGMPSRLVDIRTKAQK
jgi:Myb-like DNA-binding domain